MDGVDVNHRRVGVDAFNHVWTVLRAEERTRDQDDELLHEAHASAFHWLRAPECRPENRARSEWLCSRVYAVLGRSEPALYHARRCLEICERYGIGDFDLAYAYEALARASTLAGDSSAADDYRARGREAGAQIAEAEDRQLFESDMADLATVPPRAASG